MIYLRLHGSLSPIVLRDVTSESILVNFRLIFDEVVCVLSPFILHYIYSKFVRSIDRTIYSPNARRRMDDVSISHSSIIYFMNHPTLRLTSILPSWNSTRFRVY